MGKGGLENVVAAESSICKVNGTEGRLIYQGYDIHELAEHSNYEEVVHLLWFGRLPTREELKTLCKELGANRALPAEVVKMMKEFPKDAVPMEVLRTVASMLSMYDPDAEDNGREANIRKATRLTAQIPTIVAYWDCIRNGRATVEPREEHSTAADFLYLLHAGEEPNEVSVKSLDIALILHAEHGFNASTFAARVAAGTETDMHSAITAAIGTLKGPLHGGANQEVIKMLLEIGETAKVEAHIQKLLEEHRKIMGFGHRVYKTEDPRAFHLKKMSEALGKRLGEPKWYDMSVKIEELMKNQKGLNANVDFYSASVYYMLGIPTDLFTPIFALSRMSGWGAHVLEQLANNRLIRPTSDYTGAMDLKYVPIEERGAALESVRGS
ncbi:MAG: citrate synthase [Candidatus Melainabacteria bacterium]|nr:citrate synthase [Candidatus Melainabacteria bacterium]